MSDDPIIGALLTLKQVAEILQLSERSVRRAIAEQGLPCVEISERCRRVRREDLDQWLAERVAFRPRGPRSIDLRTPGQARTAPPQKGRLTLPSTREMPEIKSN